MQIILRTSIRQLRQQMDVHIYIAITRTLLHKDLHIYPYHRVCSSRFVTN